MTCRVGYDKLGIAKEYIMKDTDNELNSIENFWDDRIEESIIDYHSLSTASKEFMKCIPNAWSFYDRAMEFMSDEAKWACDDVLQEFMNCDSEDVTVKLTHLMASINHYEVK